MIFNLILNLIRQIVILIILLYSIYLSTQGKLEYKYLAIIILLCYSAQELFEINDKLKDNSL